MKKIIEMLIIRWNIYKSRRKVKKQGRAFLRMMVDKLK
jgi:hypothetical protein